jgi:hypothetical protein
MALADALLRVAVDSAYRKVTGAAGRRRVESLFSLAGMVEGTAKVYEQVLQR